MLGDPREVLDVPLDILGRAVVVVHDGDEAVRDGVPAVVEADGDAVDELDEEVEEEVEGVAEERAEAFFVACCWLS